MPSISFKSEAEWLALRESFIGGSEIASLFNQWLMPDGSYVILHAFEAPPEGAEFDTCLSSYSSSFRMWQQKSGVLMSSFAENERVQAGKHLEPALAAWAQEKWPDFKLRKTRRYLQHDDVPGWGCSLDYELIAPGHPPVEFKNVDYLVFRDQWGYDDDSGEIIPPIHITLQLQAQIGVTKADHGWVVVCVAGNQLHRVRIERHEATQARIGSAITLFWISVEEKIEPLWLADFDTVKELATMSVSDTLPSVDLSDNEAACRDLRRYKRWHRHFDYVKKHLDGMKARVGLTMLDRTKAHTGTEVGDITVTWPIVNRPAGMMPARWLEEKSWRAGFSVKVIKPAKPSKKAA